MCLPMLGVALGSFYFLLPSLHQLIITLGQVTLLETTVTPVSKEQQQQTQRLRGDQIEVFEILNGYGNIDCNICFKLRKAK